MVTAAENIIRGKGATNYAIGLAAARIVEAIVNDENRVLPVSTRLDDYQGIDDVCLSVPCIVNRTGVDAVLDIPLSAEEAEGLRPLGRHGQRGRPLAGAVRALRARGRLGSALGAR